MARRTFSIGGVHPADSKISRDCRIEALPLPPTVYISVAQHIGAPAVPVVAPGDKVKVTYLRDKKQHSTTLTLRNAQGTTSQLESVDTDALGASRRALTEQEKKETGLKYGILVSNIRRGKMMEAGISKGIIITQVNDVPMRTVEDFENAVKAANMSTDRVLWIRAKTQSGLNRSFTVELAEPKDKK